MTGVAVLVRGGWDGQAWDAAADDGEGDYSLVPDVIDDLPLFHWSPVERRRQIVRHGLRPGMRPSLNMEWRAPYVCFADTPSWAWALSGSMHWAQPGEWDLWETSLRRVAQFAQPLVIPDVDRERGVYELRVPARVFKRALWHVGTRNKAAD